MIVSSIAIALPLILAVVATFSYPINAKHYFNSREEYYEALRAGVSALPGYNIPVKDGEKYQDYSSRVHPLSLFFLSAFVVGFVEYLLFVLSDTFQSGIYFSYRHTDSLLLSTIVGLSAGIIPASIIGAHRALKKGRLFVEEALISGSLVENREAYASRMFVFAFIASAIAFYAHNTFIEVSDTEIRYSSGFSTQAKTIPIEQIQCLKQYKTRTKETLHVVLNDGTYRDLFYHLYPYQYDDFHRGVERSLFTGEVKLYKKHWAEMKAQAGMCF